MTLVTHKEQIHPKVWVKIVVSKYCGIKIAGSHKMHPNVWHNRLKSPFYGRATSDSTMTSPAKDYFCLLLSSGAHQLLVMVRTSKPEGK